MQQEVELIDGDIHVLVDRYFSLGVGNHNIAAYYDPHGKFFIWSRECLEKMDRNYKNYKEGLIK